MKKRGFALALILTAALCLAGCASEEVTQNEVVDENGLPSAEWTDEPVIAQVIVNSGFAAEIEAGLKISEIDSYWRVYEQWDNGELISVAPRVNHLNDLEPWASLQHEDYIFAQTEKGPGYAMDEQYIYWLEMPASYNVEAARWYLYMRAVSQDGAQGEPVCIAEGNYAATSKDVSENGIPYDWEAHDGLVLWAQLDADEVAVMLFDAARGETQELARFAAGSAEVALAENVAIWNESAQMLKHCDLTSGEIVEITANAEMSSPMIVGDHLIVLDGASEEAGAAQLLVYDLVTDEWAYRISSDLPPLENTKGFVRPQAIDDRHIALIAVSEDVYQLPAVDLETGKIYALETAPETPMLFCADACTGVQIEEDALVVNNIQLPDRGGSNPVKAQSYYDYEGEGWTLIYAIDFHW